MPLIAKNSGSGGPVAPIVPETPTPPAYPPPVTPTPAPTNPGYPGPSTATPTNTLAGPTNTPTPTNTPGATCSGSGATREVWTGITGELLSDLFTGTNNFANAPNSTDTRITFEAPTDWADNYGTRMRALLCVPSGGNYTFWIAGDDQSELRLNTTTLASPTGANWSALSAGATSIAQVVSAPGWTNSREWNKLAEQRSTAIALSPGWYYLEARHKEGTGGDNLAVSWRLNNSTTPANGDGSFIIPQTNLYPAPSGPTPTPTNTPTRTPTNTPVGPTNTPTRTPTASNTPGAGNVCPTVLDNFNRAEGAIGSNWSGSTVGFSIIGNRLDVGLGNDDIYWNPTSFGTNQEACVSLTTIDTDANNFDLLLKSQSNSSWNAGLIDVYVQPAYNTVEVWTYAPGQGWVQHGASIAVTFADGDRFGAKAKADGTVEVYKNSTLLGSRNVSSWTLHTSTLGGSIGLWFYNAGDMVVDDLAGGNSGGGGPTNTPTNTPTRTPTPTNTPVGPTNTPTRTPTPTNTSSGCPTSDDFNRGNGTNLGTNWTERVGDLEINTNLLRNVGSDSDNLATLCGASGNVLVSSQVQIATGGSGSVSVGARLGSYSGGLPGQGYTAELTSSGAVYLWRVDNWTLLGSATISGFSLNTWYTLGLRANGSALSVEVNGATVIGPVTNTAFTIGNAGVWSYAPNGADRHRFDNFSVQVIGGAAGAKVLAMPVLSGTEGPALSGARKPLAAATHRRASARSE